MEATFRRVIPFMKLTGEVDFREICTVYPDGRFEMVHTYETDDEVFVWGLWRTTIQQMGWKSIREFVKYRKGFLPI